MGDCISTPGALSGSPSKENKEDVQGSPVSTNIPPQVPSPTAAPSKENPASKSAVDNLQRFLKGNAPPSKLQEQAFATVALTARDARRAQDLLWNYHTQRIRLERAAEVSKQEVAVLASNGKPITMKYFSKLYHPAGQKSSSAAAIPLFIGLHGGGGCPPKVNDQQWENHKRIYDKTYQQVANSTRSSLLYVAPRAPTNNWNLWHEPHMDGLLDRLIETLVATQNVDSNRVYLSGYSAGGDGVYVLAPRMTDRWAAASMMAGHPNGVSLRGIYNLPFSLHVGSDDSAYNRNTVARNYKKGLENWQQAEPGGGGYARVWAKIYGGKGHGLGGQDAAAMQWMAKYTRDTTPATLVWDKGSARHSRFYWVLRCGGNPCCGGGEIRITRQAQEVLIDLTKCPEPAQIEPLTFCFNDTMVDLEKPICIYRQSKDVERQLLQEVHPVRTIGTLYETLKERGDPNAVFTAKVKVDLR